MEARSDLPINKETPMDYTATVDVKTELEVDSILEMIAPNHGALADSVDGFRATFSFPVTSLDDAYQVAMRIADTFGNPYAVRVLATAVAAAELERSELPPLLSVTQAAAMLDISPQGVRERIKAGTLRGTHVGHSWVIPLHVVLDSILTGGRS